MASGGGGGAWGAHRNFPGKKGKEEIFFFMPRFVFVCPTFFFVKFFWGFCLWGWGWGGGGASEDTRSFTDNNEKLKVLVYSARSCLLFVQKFKNTSNLISYLH